MGKGLQIRVVAEGVETREQLAFLRKRGCPEGQGYYFSRPVSASEFTQFLRHSATKSRVPDGRAVPKSLIGLRG
ncbi:MAG TPA: EAL domain-containing protein, partial [Steroidobacteraceae bacterium]